MNKELATAGLAAIAIILGIIAVDSAPTLALAAFILAAVAVTATLVMAVIKAVRT